MRDQDPLEVDATAHRPDGPARRGSGPSGRIAPVRVLRLQRRVGNAAVGRWLEQHRPPPPSPVVQRSCGCASTPGERCGSCEEDTNLRSEEGNGRAAPVQRYANCTPARLSTKDCPPRQPGERGTASGGPMAVLNVTLPGSNEKGVLIANFDIGSAAIKGNLAQTLYWKDFLRTRASDATKWRIEGFSDCQGDESRNRALRDRRAQAVLALLPPTLRARVTATTGASTGDCVTENSSAGERTLNRSVGLFLVESTYDIEPETIEGKIERKEPATDGCSTAQRDRLAIAFPLARRLGENAMSAISSMERGTPEEALLRKFFGSRAFERRWRIHQGYNRALGAMGGDPTYKCVPQGTSPCEGPTTSGYAGAHAIVFGSPVEVCAYAFNGDNIELADTILHEASHIGDWTNDLEYCSPSSGCTLETTDEVLPGIGLTDRGALNNADSFGRFASELFRR